mgnify:CR=1 FL=1
MHFLQKQDKISCTVTDQMGSSVNSTESPSKKQRTVRWILSFFLGLQLALAGYLFWIPYPITSRRSLLLIGLLTVLLSAAAFGILTRWMLPRFARTPRIVFRLCLLLSVFCSGLLILIRAVPLPDRYFFLPSGSVSIETVGTHNPSSNGSQIRLLLFDTGTTDSFSSLTQSGSWQLEGKALTTDNAGGLSWSGEVFHQIELLFETGPEAGIIQIISENETNTIDLYTPIAGEQSIRLAYPLPIGNRLIIFLSVLISLAFLFLLFFSLTVPVPDFQSAAMRPAASISWLVALPMLISWTIWLLVYWPGIMSPDSMDQWGQSLSGAFNDWHPAIYAILMRALNQIWQTPAVIGIVQIIALSLITAWGLRMLRRHGYPALVCWIMSLLFAITPLTGLLSITLWKDVPYGISLFALFLIVCEIVLSSGQQRRGVPQALGLAFALTGVVLYRHNGFPVALAAIAALLIFYPAVRKNTLAAALIAALLFLLIKYPLYESLAVNRTGMGGINQLYLHHISAHVEAQTPLKADQEDYLNELLPLEEWIYYPCNVLSLKSSAGVDFDLMYSQPKKNLEIFLDLAMQAPMVNLRHMFEANRMIWQIQPGGCYLYRVPLFKNQDGGYQWIQPNPLGVRESSKLPAFVEPFFNYYNWSASVPAADSFIWRPALTSYIALLTAVVLALRMQKKRWLLIGLVPFVQFSLMLVLNFAQDMRFQYGNMLIGLFSLGLLFLQQQDNEKV